MARMLLIVARMRAFNALYLFSVVFAAAGVALASAPLTHASEPGAARPPYVSQACGAPPKDLIKISWMFDKPKWIFRVLRPNHELLVHRWDQNGGTLDFLERTLKRTKSGQSEWSEHIAYEYSATTGRLLHVYTFEKANRGVRVAYPIPLDLDLEKLRGKDGWITLSAETLQTSASASLASGVKTVRFPAPSNLLQAECFALTTGFRVPTLMPGPMIIQKPSVPSVQRLKLALPIHNPNAPESTPDQGLPPFDEDRDTDSDGWNHENDGRWKVEDESFNSSDSHEPDPTP